MTAFAEDDTEWVDNPGADKILVDVEHNTITFIYDETNTELMERWRALPSFEDVPEDYEYQLYISYLSQLGVMDGTTETTFSPEQAITAAALAKTICLVEHAAPVPNNDKAFLSWTAEQGILSSGRLYRTITHAEAVEILSRLVQYDMEQTAIRKGTTLSQAACEREIAAVLGLSGLFAGGTNTIIAPDAPLTRAEAALMLSGYLFHRDKPTFITGTTPIFYIGEEDPVPPVETNTAEGFNPDLDKLRTFYPKIPEAMSQLQHHQKAQMIP